MKLTQFAKLLSVVLTCGIIALGCRKTPVNVTELPGYKPGIVGDPFATNGLDTSLVASTNGPLPMSDPEKRKDWARDHEVFKANTVHFEYDSSVVKSGE